MLDFHEMKQAFRGDFMQPEIVQGRHIGEDVIVDHHAMEYDAAGWYARLSASGFLDCTDWVGPFADPDDAMRHLYETYAE